MTTKEMQSKYSAQGMPSNLSLSAHRNREIAQFFGWVFSFAIFFGLYIYYVRKAVPLVPYMDSIRYIGQVHDALTGAVSWFDLWHQAGSVGIFYQLVTLFEWVFWGLNSQVTVIFTALVWASL